MYSNVVSASICGLEAQIVHVEADVGMGLPVFEMSGFLGIEVKEARERVRAAIKNSGVELKPQRIVINISPANIRKDGTGFDLPIALAILVANNLVNEERLKDTLIVGELSLDGTIHGVKGILPCVSAAVDSGITTCIVPMENRKEAAIVDGIRVLAVENLEQVIAYLNGKIELTEEEHTEGVLSAFLIGHSREAEENHEKAVYIEEGKEKSIQENHLIGDDGNDEDFSDIRGQYMAKRATMIAVAGMHNIIYIGTPGSGKSMLAKRIPTIMPDLSYEESLEVTKICSVAGILEKDEGLIHKRPFRSPHHNITEAAMLGGGAIPRPGEITLAGKGVLFLDEMTEFKSTILESLRQPLEDKKITLVRLDAAYTYPADFMLAAAMNPCKCGYYPDRTRCTCTEHDIRRYMGKISAPMWDRFDLCVKTDEIKFADLQDDKSINHDCKVQNVRDGLTENQEDREENKKENKKDNIRVMTTAYMKQQVEHARQIQQKRFAGRKINFNSEMNTRDIKKYCQLNEQCQKIMEAGFEKLQLTARGYHKILKTARTIADLDGCEQIELIHLSEAMGYRSCDISLNKLN
ncbi:MAG: YifB family Mg chelatase-like AAA ATPase [Lachnospira sp.]|nr:YifB family Mg chelatase-like AAA ATPase [Lachnospira sp.]